MRNALAFRRRHLVRADIETTIDGGRIAADDLAVEMLSQLDGQRALAGRRGADDGDQHGVTLEGLHGPLSKQRKQRPETDQQPLRLTSGGLRQQHPYQSSAARWPVVEIEGDREERLIVGILLR